MEWREFICICDTTFICDRTSTHPFLWKNLQWYLRSFKHVAVTWLPDIYKWGDQTGNLLLRVSVYFPLQTWQDVYVSHAIILLYRANLMFYCFKKLGENDWSLWNVCKKYVSKLMNCFSVMETVVYGSIIKVDFMMH